MLQSSSPFWRPVDSPDDLTCVDDDIKFDGSLDWVWTIINGEEDAEKSTLEGKNDDEDERQQGPSKRQKTKGGDDPNPNMDGPSTWQVEETKEDLQTLVEDAASKGVALPPELLTFVTTQRIHDAYFDNYKWPRTDQKGTQGRGSFLPKLLWIHLGGYRQWHLDGRMNPRAYCCRWSGWDRGRSPVHTLPRPRIHKQLGSTFLL